MNCSVRWDNSPVRRHHRHPAPQSPFPWSPDDAAAPGAVDSVASIWSFDKIENIFID